MPLNKVFDEVFDFFLKIRPLLEKILDPPLVTHIKLGATPRPIQLFGSSHHLGILDLLLLAVTDRSWVCRQGSFRSCCSPVL